MGKAIWKGVMQIGKLEIEGSLEVGIEGKEIDLHQFHCDCKGRLKQKLFCPVCNKDILDKENEIIKGYGDKNPIFLTKEEIESCKKDSTKRIDVFQFVKTEINPIYNEKPLSFKPADTSLIPFALTWQTLKKENLIGLGKLVMRGKDHFFKFYAHPSGCIGIFDLHFPEELRQTEEIPKVKEMEFDTDTLNLASKLFGNMTREFNPQLIKDEYTIQLKEIVKAKSEGKVIAIEEVKETKKTLSLQEALKESLAVNF